MPDSPQGTGPATAVRFDDVSFVRDDRRVLDRIDWEVRDGERWVVLGRNGSGKTSLVRLAALYEHPSSGRLHVLGEELGRADVRALRRRIGFASAAFLDLLRPELSARDVVMCATNAALEPWWHTYTDADRARATDVLQSVGIGALAHRRLATLSSGERQRVQLARILMNSPELIVVDEPTAGLDLAGREQFVHDLDRMAAASDAPLVLVTHHVEEIPASFTHVLMIRDGTVLDAGPIGDHLTAASLSECFGVDLSPERRDDRFTAWARRPVPEGHDRAQR